MKNLLILICCLCLNGHGFGQIITEVDQVFPYQDELSAIKKDGKWGFINKEGVLEVEFRDDIVFNSNGEMPYPVFKNGRCLIKRIVGNSYKYGYINTNGAEVIPPQYMNASNFKDGYAIVIKLLKDTIGYNQVFKKDLTTYKLEEYVIDTLGKTIKFLENPINHIPTKIPQKIPPKFHSKFLAPNIVGAQKKNMKWDIYKF